jgi:hypothetical protein
MEGRSKTDKGKLVDAVRYHPPGRRDAAKRRISSPTVARGAEKRARGEVARTPRPYWVKAAEGNPGKTGPRLDR